MLTVETGKKKDVKRLMFCEDGYFTLEAAFIVPMVFVLLLVVMLSALYLCDLNQAKSYLNSRVTELSGSGETYKSSTLQEDKKRLDRLLFIADIKKLSIVKNDDKVKGELELSMRLQVPLLDDWFGTVWTDSFSCVVEMGDNAERMRRWSLLE